jgi:hypothetical protein
MGRISHAIFAAQLKVLTTQLEKDYQAGPGKPRPASIEMLLTNLRRDMDLLLKSWFVMASRNLLTSMQRDLLNVINTEPDLKPNSKEAAQMLIKHIEKLLGIHTLTKARYDSVLLCGYKVKAAYHEFRGDPDDYDDMKQKCELMKKAIRAAYANVHPDHKANDRMLKIFMAPEFFFRGANGGYEARHVGGEVGKNGQPAKEGLMDLMLAEIGNANYNHWLFVLGTAIVVARSTQHVCQNCKQPVEFKPDGTGTGATTPKCSKDPGHTVKEVTIGASVENVAFICKDKTIHTISKELVSNQDFVAETNWNPGSGKWEPNRGWAHVDKEWLRVDDSKKDTKYQDERMGGAIFTLDGVTFGCEICLDHAASWANNKGGRLESAAGIQIQLIPSAGMSIRQFRTMQNGVVFNVDGTSPHVQAVGLTGPDSLMMYEMAPNKAVPGSGDIAQMSHLQSWDKTKMAEALDYYEKGQADPQWLTDATAHPVAVDNTPGAGSILIYGPFEIPKP